MLVLHCLSTSLAGKQVADALRRTRYLFPPHATDHRTASPLQVHSRRGTLASAGERVPAHYPPTRRACSIERLDGWTYPTITLARGFFPRRSVLRDGARPPTRFLRVDSHHATIQDLSWTFIDTIISANRFRLLPYIAVSPRGHTRFAHGARAFCWRPDAPVRLPPPTYRCPHHHLPHPPPHTRTHTTHAHAHTTHCTTTHALHTHTHTPRTHTRTHRTHTGAASVLYMWCLAHAAMPRPSNPPQLDISHRHLPCTTQQPSPHGQLPPLPPHADYLETILLRDHTLRSY